MKQKIYRAEAWSGWLSSSRNKKSGGCCSLPVSITQSLSIHVTFFFFLELILTQKHKALALLVHGFRVFISFDSPGERTLVYILSF